MNYPLKLPNFILFIVLFINSITLTVYAEEVNNNTAEIPSSISTIDKSVVDNTAIEALISELTSNDLKKKLELVKKISDSSHTNINKILTALLNKKLFYIRETKKVVIAIKGEDIYDIFDPLTDEKLNSLEKSKIKKIRINNKLRITLRKILAEKKLQSIDPDIRLTAVKEMSKKLNDETLSLFEKILESEKDTDVIMALNIQLAIGDLMSGNSELKVSALTILSKTVNPIAIQKIKDILKQDASGHYLEHDIIVIDAAKIALTKIENKLEYYNAIETVFFGLSLGSVLLLVAIGLAITFGVMGVINMAHGELMMLGAYTTYVVQLIMPNYIDYSLFVAIPAAFLVSGLFGVLIERGVIRHLYGRPLETLLATFGISLILQQLVRSVFSPLNRSVSTPSWMSGSLEINNALSFTFNRVYILVFSIIVFITLLLILKKTVLGLQVRAVSQNRNMAKAMGIKTEWIDALTFGLGSGVAGVAGVALSQLTNVGPNLGQSYIIDSFMVVVFGGVGNLWGTLVGAMSLGVFNKVLEPWSGAVLAKILVLVFIILFIQKRPRGLFPKKGRGADD